MPPLNEQPENITVGTFSVGDSIDTGLDIFKKAPVPMALFMLIVMIISVVLSNIPEVGTWIQTFIQTPLYAGLFIVAHKLHFRNEYQFEEFFHGFMKMGKMAGLSAFYIISLLAVFVPLFLIIFAYIGFSSIDNLETNPEEFVQIMQGLSPILIVLIIVAFLLIMMISFIYTFAIPYAVVLDLGIGESISKASSMFFKNIPQMLLLALLGIGLIILGLVGFCIGVVFTVALYYCMLYAAFAQANNITEEGIQLGLHDHLIEDVNDSGF